jgi:hypothetical protein
VLMAASLTLPRSNGKILIIKRKDGIVRHCQTKRA